MKVSATVKNNVGKFVQKQKREAPDRIGKAVLKAGGIVRDEQKANAPTRKIGNALRVNKFPNFKNNPAVAIGLKRNHPGWVGKFYEKGTRGHDISPVHSNVLVFSPRKVTAIFSRGLFSEKKIKVYRKRDGAYTENKHDATTFIRGTVHHPGMKKAPFQSTAAKRKLPEVEIVIKNAAAEVIAKAARESK